MPRYTGTVGVGDVICTREGKWWISAGIRLGAVLMGLPAFVNHVIIVHHMDERGSWQGIEGRPGGVGWVDLKERLGSPLTNANVLQPKTDAQRYLIATAAEALVNVPYDWATIAEHTAVALRLRRQAVREWPEDEVPGHVVCSSYADWAYEKVGLSNPGGLSMTRMTTPAHWDRFITRKEWG